MLLFPQRVTDPFLDVIADLLAHPTGVHGYDISRCTRTPRPTVYRVLSRLELMGWTVRTITVADATRPPRHLHTLTRDGDRAARNLLAARRPTATA